MTKEEAIKIFERFVESKRTQKEGLHMMGHYGWCLVLKVNGETMSSVAVYFSPSRPGLRIGENDIIEITKEESESLKQLVENKGKSNLTFEESLQYL